MYLSPEEALRLLLDALGGPTEQEAPLDECRGRVLLRDLYAPRPMPPFDRSPLDGYALRAADAAGAGPQNPVGLPVALHLFAGDAAQTPLAPGCAARVMTGAMLPAGADCVLRQEDTDEGEDFVRLFAAPRAGENLCRRGEEYPAGELLLPAGQRLDAAALAVAAGAGFAALPVPRRVRVALLSTGDELVSPGGPLPEGCIYNSSAAYLTARLGEMGAVVTGRAAAGDDLPQLCAALEALAPNADILLTTGGVSVGRRDLLPAALDAFGARLLFHGLNCKPGMPTLLARRGRLIVLGLSGNPFSAAVPFELLLQPALARLTAAPEPVLPVQLLPAQNAYPKPSPGRRFLRARAAGGTVQLPTAQANGQLRSFLGCNCLVDLPAGSPPVCPGDPLRVLWLYPPGGLPDGGRTTKSAKERAFYELRRD